MADFHEMPLGSFLVFVNQPQKNNVLSLFEKQVYPHRLLPNGDAEAPYDVAGWTLPLQMGVDYEPAWQIKDLDAARGTLKRIENIDQARGVMNLAPSPRTVCQTAKSAQNESEDRPLQGLYRLDGRGLDAVCARYFSDTVSLGFGQGHAVGQSRC